MNIRAQFGVAETGAIWLTQEDLVVDAPAFLSPNPIVLLDPEQIVSDIQEASCRVQLNKMTFGRFMMGRQRLPMWKPLRCTVLMEIAL
ncbi:MAG: LUD domain-containing protein [Acidobacteriaceae bacterium]